MIFYVKKWTFIYKYDMIEKEVTYEFASVKENQSAL